jgi:signal transduction histidine kinase
VILNLLVNAAHAIEEANGARNPGSLGLIRVSTRGTGNSVEIRISDTGTGIPEAIRSRIFEPFFTTKGVGKGTGQGLAIARAVIVDKHGGSLDLLSETGVGTTFIIRLPIAQAGQP